ETALRRLAQRFGQPAALRDFAFGNRGEFAFLRLLPGRSGCAFDLLQRFEDTRLADLGEVVVGCRREPRGHVELECGGQPVGVSEPGIAGASFFRLTALTLRDANRAAVDGAAVASNPRLSKFVLEPHKLARCSVKFHFNHSPNELLYSHARA